MTRVVIHGEGVFARLAHFYLTHDSDHEVVAFSVDGQPPTEAPVPGVPVVSWQELVVRYPPGTVSLLVAMGPDRVNRDREAAFRQIETLGYDFVSYISSRAVVSSEAQIGRSCLILEAAVVQPFARIGDDVVIWSGSHVGHESVIGDHSFLAAHVVVSGNVVIEPNCLLEANSAIRNGITVGSHGLIGAGAVITKSTRPGAAYQGTPAELLPVGSDRLPAV